MEGLVMLLLAGLSLGTAYGLKVMRLRRYRALLEGAGCVPHEGGWVFDEVYLNKHRRVDWWTARVAVPGFGSRGRLRVSTRHQGRATVEADTDDGMVFTPLGREDLDPRVVVVADHPDFTRGLLTTEAVVLALKPLLSLGPHLTLDTEAPDLLRVQLAGRDARITELAPGVARLASALRENIDAPPRPLMASFGARALKGGSSADGSPVAISLRPRD